MIAAATVFMEGVPPYLNQHMGGLRHLAASFLLSCVRTQTYIRDSLIARESAASFLKGAPTEGHSCPEVPQPQCPHCGRPFAAWHLAKARETVSTRKRHGGIWGQGSPAGAKTYLSSGDFMGSASSVSERPLPEDTTK